ncbi:hypothetical protein ABTX81_30400 [Kitasatospora sp. NPDC097605]|uniref:hypothetical protein n=1 Tax=Kitasatospora sp. NPDC097605 TaxID=3157226 RepID=UPI0033282DDF
MTQQPYTDIDLRIEAASQLDTAGEDFSYLGIAEAMQGEEPWSTLDAGDFDTAHRKIDDLLRNAPGLGDWAVEMGADGLVPYDRALTVLGDTSKQPLVRVHFAFAPEMSEAARNAFVTGLGEATNANL